MPLHVAVIKERPLIVKELVEACEMSVHEITHRGETILHLAVKSNSFDTLELLISRVDDINVKDEKGYTVLHLAVSRKQLSVIKLLLRNRKIDVNSMNSNGFTPLDMLLESPQEYGDLVLGEMIRAAGGKTSAEVVPPHALPEIILREDSKLAPQLAVMPNKLTKHSLGKNVDVEITDMDSEENTKEKKHNPGILMVVAILISTITFQAALNPPGGFQPNGQAVLAHDLKRFVIYDMIGLFLSISVILLFLCVVPKKRVIVIKFLVWILWLATLSTALAFTSAVGRIFHSSKKPVGFLSIGWLVLLIFGLWWTLIQLIIFFINKMKRTDHRKCCTCLINIVYSASILFVIFVLAIINFIVIVEIIVLFKRNR
ncbi:hypothetical protein LUZ60_014935 [Juncus effusus]|nr:hypothetical protein LUZ60_014935 [Juncus effusus]